MEQIFNKFARGEENNDVNELVIDRKFISLLELGK